METTHTPGKRQQRHQHTPPRTANKPPTHKYLLDLAMTTAMILLMKITFTGMLIHELLGIGVFMLFAIHNLLNWKCTKAMLKKLFDKKIPLKARIGILLDIALTLNVTLIVSTGILISKEIFSFSADANLLSTLSALHHSTATLGLLLISIHIGLHWNPIMATFRKLFNLKTLDKARTYALRAVTLAIVALGIRGSYTQDVGTNLAQILNTSDDNTAQTEKTNKSYTPASADATTPATSTTSLADYLTNLHCTGCSKHCPLSAPQCATGIAQAQKATQDYQTTQTTATSDTTTTPSTPESGTTTPSKETSTTATTPAVPTLEEYLSKLHCTACLKHCPLTAPQCASGEQAAAQAQSAYYAQYADTIPEGSNTDANPTLREVLTDYVSIMGLYISGTHYLMLLPKALGRKEER